MIISYPALGQWGRLGNQLWEIASTLGIAAERGAEVEFNRWDYEEFFEVPKSLFVDEPQGVCAAEFATTLPPSERMYLQSYDLWSDIRDTIWNYFRPSERSLEQLAEFNWFFDVQRPRVALHVRRDERVHSFHDSHPHPPNAYYHHAIEHEKERFGNPTFCVFSDDIQWCKERFPEDFVFVEGYPRYQDTYLTENEPAPRDHLDLFLMSYCDGHIIPNSTFSWWGAALSNNPHPIYPAVWYGPALAHVDWRLQIPPGWKEIGW